MEVRDFFINLWKKQSQNRILNGIPILLLEIEFISPTK